MNSEITLTESAIRIGSALDWFISREANRPQACYIRHATDQPSPRWIQKSPWPSHRFALDRHWIGSSQERLIGRKPVISGMRPISHPRDEFLDYLCYIGCQLVVDWHLIGTQLILDKTSIGYRLGVNLRYIKCPLVVDWHLIGSQFVSD